MTIVSYVITIIMFLITVFAQKLYLSYLFFPFFCHYILLGLILLFYRVYSREYGKAFLLWILNIFGIGFFYIKFIDELTNKDFFID